MVKTRIVGKRLVTEIVDRVGKCGITPEGGVILVAMGTMWKELRESDHYDSKAGTFMGIPCYAVAGLRTAYRLCVGAEDSV